MSAAEGLLTVNGRPADRTAIPPSERLLDTLRWRLGLKGTKEGCRSGQCGACTVLVNGESLLACLVLTAELGPAEVTTIEGIAGRPEGRAAQAAFEAAEAVQCGYCTPGFVVALAGLLAELGPEATRERLLAELPGNLCRCTGYAAIVRAVDRLVEASR